ncbi:unnamed protein product [Ixodes hexagonus]
MDQSVVFVDCGSVLPSNLHLEPQWNSIILVNEAAGPQPGLRRPTAQYFRCGKRGTKNNGAVNTPVGDMSRYRNSTGSPKEVVPAPTGANVHSINSGKASTTLLHLEGHRDNAVVIGKYGPSPRVTCPMKKFLQTVRLFPFLYDKTHPHYKDKEVKLKQWEIIGRAFGLNGRQAAAKFRNVRDRWLKIVTGIENSRGKAGKGLKWPLFHIVDGMLRNTPHYAEKIVQNIQLEQERCVSCIADIHAPQSCSSGSSNQANSPVLLESDESSDDLGEATSQAILAKMCFGSHAGPLSEDDMRWVPDAFSASIVKLCRRPPKKGVPGTQLSRTKKQKSDDSFDQAIRDVLGTCSATLDGIQKKNRQEQAPPGDDCQQGGNWIAAKLRSFPPKKRCEVMFKINTLLYEAEMDGFQ